MAATMAARRNSRHGTRVIWLCLHTSEGNGTARQLRDADWWEGSSHAICDQTELLTAAQGCVDPAFAAWTLRDGNPRSENIEQIGQASWTREHWLTERMPQLRLTAKWLADRATARGIPLTYIGAAGVRARAAGVIQHNDYTVGTGDGDHWDCGPGYPVDVVIELAREIAAGTTTTARIAGPPEEDDMFSDDDRQLLREVRQRLDDAGPIGSRTKESRDRVLGMLQQRWYKVDAGKTVRCPSSDPDAVPCSALDTLDGGYLVDRIAAVARDVTTLMEKATPAPRAPRRQALTAAEIAAGVPSTMVREVLTALELRVGAAAPDAVPVG